MPKADPEGFRRSDDVVALARKRENPRTQIAKDSGSPSWRCTTG